MRSFGADGGPNRRPQVRQKISDDIASFKATERAYRGKLDLPVRRSGALEEDRNVGRCRCAGILGGKNCQSLRRPGDARFGNTRGTSRNNNLRNERDDRNQPQEHAGYLRPEYSSICVFKSSGYEILTSVISAPSDP
jgi:hypothetical protein